MKNGTTILDKNKTKTKLFECTYFFKLYMFFSLYYSLFSITKNWPIVKCEHTVFSWIPDGSFKKDIMISCYLIILIIIGYMLNSWFPEQHKLDLGISIYSANLLVNDFVSPSTGTCNWPEAHCVKIR